MGETTEVVTVARVYAKKRPLAGIYKIRCLPNGLEFCGTSVRVFARWRQDIALLVLGHHADEQLQSLWNTHGPANFEWTIQMLIETKFIDNEYRADARFLLCGLRHRALMQAKILNEPHRLLEYAEHRGTKLVNFYADNCTYQDYHYPHMKEHLNVDRNIRGKIAGVYSFERRSENQIYIGASRNIGERWKGHLQGFFDGTHHNKAALELWQETDPTQWTFQIRELCEESELAEIEKAWIAAYRSNQEFTVLNSTRPGAEN